MADDVSPTLNADPQDDPATDHEDHESQEEALALADSEADLHQEPLTPVEEVHEDGEVHDEHFHTEVPDEAIESVETPDARVEELEVLLSEVMAQKEQAETGLAKWETLFATLEAEVLHKLEGLEAQPNSTEQLDTAKAEFTSALAARDEEHQLALDAVRGEAAGVQASLLQTHEDELSSLRAEHESELARLQEVQVEDRDEDWHSMVNLAEERAENLQAELHSQREKHEEEVERLQAELSVEKGRASLVQDDSGELDSLRAQVESLELRLAQAQAESDARVAAVEAKAEADRLAVVAEAQAILKLPEGPPNGYRGKRVRTGEALEAKPVEPSTPASKPEPVPMASGGLPRFMPSELEAVPPARATKGEDAEFEPLTEIADAWVPQSERAREHREQSNVKEEPARSGLFKRKKK